MASFGFNKQATTAKDSGPKMKILTRICGLVLIGGTFLTFLLGESWLTIGEGLPVAIDAVGFSGTIEGLFGGTTVPGTLTKSIVMLAFLVFPVIGLLMLLRGRYKGGQLTFLLLFNLTAWLMVNFFGGEADISGNFFANAGIGYWIACAALFVPFVGMIFLDESI
ncbi:MAG: hypothetical protein AAGN35_01865 [Bacteroidota bacterium]